jgi:heparin/heparan-sulfate lyase
VAGDATATYHPDKCRLALRQFVFIPPNHFVVFDRVSAARPDYLKTWLLHAAAEPRVEGREFSAPHEEGRLFCRTLLPEQAKLRVIGGPGRQFWSDGRNWPLPPGYRTPDTTPLLGQWRVEVSPREGREEDLFLHLIETGDAAAIRMALSRLVRRGDRIGVQFRVGEDRWEVIFDTADAVGGHVSLRRGGKLQLDRELVRKVAPQSGLWGRP